jgi:hypothetical protein
MLHTGAMLSTVLFTGSTSPVPAGSSPPSAATTESPAGGVSVFSLLMF